MLLPKKTKFRRPHRVKYEGPAKKGTTIEFGEWGIVAQQGNWVTNRQIESARIAMTRYMKRFGKVWIRIFPHFAQTKKPLGVRMGSGKGSPEAWVAVVKKGTVMFEIAGVSDEMAQEALRLAMHKLPMKCKVLNKATLNGIDKLPEEASKQKTQIESKHKELKEEQ